MKQQIVINVPLIEEESRKKAMKLASETKGVSKVEVVKDRNQLVVVGEGIDSVKLVNSLRKKFCFANILTIHNVLEEDEPPIHYHYPPGYYPLCDPNPPTCCLM